MRLRRTVTHTFAVAALWWILSEGDAGSWAVGIPAVALVTAFSLAVPLALPWRWRWSAVPRFALFFVKQSILGGIDVARRAFAVRLPLQPALVDYPLHLPPGPARVFMLNTLSLLPGTLSAEIQENHVTAHVIDIGQPVEKELRHLEKLVGALFAVPLPPERELGRD